jgi:hypothetical protein
LAAFNPKSPTRDNTLTDVTSRFLDNLFNVFPAFLAINSKPLVIPPTTFDNPHAKSFTIFPVVFTKA